MEEAVLTLLAQVRGFCMVPPPHWCWDVCKTIPCIPPRWHGVVSIPDPSCLQQSRLPLTASCDIQLQEHPSSRATGAQLEGCTTPRAE